MEFVMFNPSNADVIYDDTMKEVCADLQMIMGRGPMISAGLVQQVLKGKEIEEVYVADDGKGTALVITTKEGDKIELRALAGSCMSARLSYTSTEEGQITGPNDAA